mmetsp:Transcript_27304/g.47102  ORF Transcript_27304/g.47102 Transcript_27304/m.47102 type:complete len:446 (-) Transcript_27304:300-1637(-)
MAPVAAAGAGDLAVLLDRHAGGGPGRDHEGTAWGCAWGVATAPGGAVGLTGPADVHGRLLRGAVGVHHLSTASVGDRLRVVHGLGTSSCVGRPSARRGGVAVGDLALLDVGLELGAALVLALVEGNVERLRGQHLAIHLRDSLLSLLRGREAHEAEALRDALVVLHDCAADDGSVRGKLDLELLFVDGVVDVLHVGVAALILLDAFKLHMLKLGPQLCLSFGLLLGPPNKQWPVASNVLPIHGFSSLLGTLGVVEVDEAKATGSTCFIPHDDGAGYLAELLEHLSKLVLVDIQVQILHEDVREVPLGMPGAAVHPTDKRPDENLLAVEQHAVNLLHGKICSFLGLEVHETVSLALARRWVHGDFARANGSEGDKSVVQRLVVNGFVEVLHEHVSRATLAKTRIPLRPHDATWLSQNVRVVQRFQSSISILRIVEVDIGVSERTSR